MNEVAVECGVSKATLYHYFQDKYEMLVAMADDHSSRLVAIVTDEAELGTHGEERFHLLIHRIVAENKRAESKHQVLLRDARFLRAADMARIGDKQKRVVESCAAAIEEMMIDELDAHLAKPLTMLMFGMINWMVTWMKPEGALSHPDVASMVVDLFLGGVARVEAEQMKVRRSETPSKQAAVDQIAACEAGAQR
ncbi:TetR/AcrR family transcriptional regulator [Variovorax sp. V118]|uniref:TetR/AcrR family transcriptional regulator n=1 Tax=Variovorax sp. V118 TaxID=3065954 RepID=UPI0034E87239